MTQQVIHCRVILVSKDPMVDNCSMGFTFEATGSDPGFTFDNSAPPAALLAAFTGSAYTASGGSGFGTMTHPIGYYIDAVMNRAANDCYVETTDVTGHLDGSPAGSALRYDYGTLTATGATGTQPEYVAVGVGWRGNYGAAPEFAPGSRPRSRLRNRCYIGPIGFNPGVASTSLSTGATVLANTLLTDLEVMLEGLSTNNTLIATNHAQWDLVAWSKKNAAVYDAEWGAVNPRFVSQRRRSENIVNENWFAIS